MGGGGSNSVIVGGCINRVSLGGFSFIGGGCCNNVVGDGFTGANDGAVVVGGSCNTALCDYTFVGGGTKNSACGNYSFVGGGRCNTDTSVGGGCCGCAGGAGQTGTYSFIGGGDTNVGSGDYAVLGGGLGNSATGDCSVVVGGAGNTIDTGAIGSFIGGGYYGVINAPYSFIGASNPQQFNCNQITSTATGSFIGTGGAQTVTSRFSFVGSGYGNIILSTTGELNTIVGGCGNSMGSGTVTNQGNIYAAFIGGGCANNIGNDATGSSVVGGGNNIICGDWSVIAGGRQNEIFNSDFSFIGGGFSNLVTGADYAGVFGFDLTNNIACSFMSNQFVASNLVGTTVALCVGTNGVIVRNESDCRLKTQICPITYGLNTVQQLNPVSFFWNDDQKATRGSEKQIGFIAQEVQPIIEEIVGVSAESGMYSLSTDKLIPVLTKAVQELKAENDALKARIEAIEAIVIK
jgi:hypothetical protein